MVLRETFLRIRAMIFIIGTQSLPIKILKLLLQLLPIFVPYTKSIYGRASNKGVVGINLVH